MAGAFWPSGFWSSGFWSVLGPRLAFRFLRAHLTLLARFGGEDWGNAAGLAIVSDFVKAGYECLARRYGKLLKKGVKGFLGEQDK